MGKFKARVARPVHVFVVVAIATGMFLQLAFLEIAETYIPPGSMGDYQCPGCLKLFKHIAPPDGGDLTCPECGGRERLTPLGPAED